MTAKEFLFALPNKVKKEAVEGLETIFHFDFSEESYTLTLKEGQLHADEGLLGDPKCVVRASADDFVKFVSGDLNPMMAILTGKVKVSNQGEMLKYAKKFGLM